MRWLALLAPLFLLLLGQPMPARAADDGVNHAGVIVRQGDGSFIYGYVAFTEETLTGIELLERSGIPLVTAGFGGLGSAVCSLDGQGCGLAECKRSVCQGGADAPYWQYFRQDGSGVWAPRIVGASATTVRDGDIDGWSWTAAEAGLPAMILSDLASLAGADAALPPGPEGHSAAWRRTGDAPAAAGRGAEPAALAAAGVILAALGGGAAAAFLRRRRAAAPDAEAG